ncbi:MAG: ABC transporter permease [Geminicoccaceae bacterium]|nr:ABC transporter permease [Geminicoccaceae bacterium]
MSRYLVRRLLQFVPMLLGIATLVFFLVHLTPGGPVVALAGEFVTAETRAAIERLYGLDRPLFERYLRFLGLLLQGELGQSYGFKAPVLEVVLDRVPATLMLMVPAIVLSAVVGVGCGALAARRRGTFGEATVVTCTLVCYAVPIFWLGQLLLFAFSIQAGWFPTHGMVDPRANASGLGYWLDVAHHAVLPCLTLTLHQLAFTVLISRASLFAEMQRPYFTTALAKGLSLGRAQYAHALPNGILPVVTLIGNRVGWLIAGAVLVENVFAWPGLGRLIVGASLDRDYPLIIGVLLFVAAITLVANLITDLVYGLIDPRIRQGWTLDAG